MTDFENAALVTFIVLLTRAIMTYNLNLLIPISNVRNVLMYHREIYDYE
jgi:glutamate--cysteine ligase catalytic subunit